MADVLLLHVGWTPWTARTTPGALTSSPTATSSTPDRLEVYFRGPDNRLHQITATDDTWTTTTPTAVPGGPTITTAPGATTPTPGRTDLLAGCTNGLCWWTNIDGTWTYRGAASPPGTTTTPTSPPTLTSPRDGWITATLRNPTNDITRLSYAIGGDWWATDLPASSAPGQPVALTHATTATSSSTPEATPTPSPSAPSPDPSTNPDHTDPTRRPGETTT